MSLKSISLSGRAAKAARLAFCLLVRGGRFARSTARLTNFLLIASPFFPVGRSGRDNSDDLDRLSVLLFIPDGMGYDEEQMPLHDPQGRVRLFWVLLDQTEIDRD